MFAFLKALFSPPPQLPPEPRITIGTYQAGRKTLPFSYSLKDFRSNFLIRAVSGAGKSYLMLNILIALLTLKEPFTLIDPHSDLAIAFLKYLIDTGFFNDERAYRRIIYCKFSRDDFYLPFNCLNQERYTPYILASHIHEAISRAFPSDSPTPLMSTILVPSLIVLIKNHRPITDLMRLLENTEWREHLLANVDDQEVIDYFHNRFDNVMKPSSLGSVSRRIQMLTFTPALRYTLGQPENLFDIRKLMDEGTSLLLDFAGSDFEVIRLLACLLTVFYEKAALSREDTDESKRRPHHLILDESPLLVSSSAIALEAILEQTRKYGLFLKLCHQHMKQFNTELHASLAQVQNEIVLQQTEEDAKASAHRFSGIRASYYEQRQKDPTLPSPAEIRERTMLALEDLTTGHAWVRKGKVIQPITTLRIPEPHATRQDVERVTATYARMYGTPAAQLRSLRPHSAPQPPQPSAEPQEENHEHWLEPSPPDDGFVPFLPAHREHRFRAPRSDLS